MSLIILLPPHPTPLPTFVPHTGFSINKHHHFIHGKPLIQHGLITLFKPPIQQLIMCSSNSKVQQSNEQPTTTTTILERRSLKKTLSLPKSITMTTNPKSPRQPAVKREMNTSSDKLILPPPKPTTPKHVKKSKKCSSNDSAVDSPGSIAAARREQVAVMQVQRKMRIAHYGRSKSAKYDFDSNSVTPANVVRESEKRCSFITPNSDPVYVAYHDYEWGVPAHDDKMLFELLVLTGAQVGSDWTSVLKKRQQFREAFSGFDAETVSKYSEKKIQAISNEYGIQLSLVRGVVDNSKSIIQVNKAFGSFDNYIWGFVNNKPIMTQYKSSHKMPVKTSKAEAISKDMVRRGFRQVGPTVIHSFMQAAGLTNDHLTICPRHHQCVMAVSPNPLISVN